MKKAINLNGTISGEHGIGMAKRPFLHMELSEEIISIQRSIKRIFDPKNILNPQKVFE